jgi:NADH-quinone oxidoreductase subunit G
MATIEINGKKIEVTGNKSIIEVADENNVYIPRFCYHKKLSVAANCRMCLVEVSNSKKTVPACATPIVDGLKVFTQSAATLHSQKAVMEFLLINHPLDCPICDQGGQCELQDLAMGFGKDSTEYNQAKHSVDDTNLGPLVATEMTRCIHCTRCVRFTEEIAGLQELGGTNRGEELHIGTYVERALQSELSGNIIEICPVGALLSKPALYQMRAWELHQYPSIAAHDCVGSHVFYHTRRGQVLRAVSEEHEPINEIWISDRDRFSYLGIHTFDRLQKPKIKMNGEWQETDWSTALRFAVEGIERVIHQEGASKVGALASPSSTVEELYLLQKLMRAAGVNNIDYRLRQMDFADQDLLPQALGTTISFEDIEKQNAILLIGSHIRHEQPLLGHRVRKASLKGSKIMAINMIDHEFNFSLSEKIIRSPAQFIAALQQILKALLQGKEVQDYMARLVEHVTISDSAAQKIADQLSQAENSVIFLGAFAHQHPQASTIRILATAIAELSHSKIGFLTEGANTYGAALAGALPHRGIAGKAIEAAGLTVSQMLENPLSAYVLMGIEPELDMANSAQALQVLKQAKFVVSITAYENTEMNEYAHVMLPMATIAETSGTFVNAEGKWQSFKGAISPVGEARPAWKILRVLGNLFEFAAFDYQTSEQVRNELLKLLEQEKSEAWSRYTLLSAALRLLAQDRHIFGSGLQRITAVPMYSVDAMVRRSKALQEVYPHQQTEVRVHPVTAQQQHWQQEQVVKIKQGQKSAKFTVCLDVNVPEQCVLINGGTHAAVGLGEAFGAIEVSA